MIELNHVTKRYGATVAVDDLSLTVEPGELAVLLGPSGCGKTTSLRAINRMVEIDSGAISVSGTDIREQHPDELRRHIGYCIQSVGLFPHMTVARNIGVVPRLLGWEQPRIDRRVTELLELVGLDPAEYADKRPRALSGGEAQRIGVARALAADPPVLLMDEPFGALDPLTRARLQQEFRNLQQLLGKTVVFVTHDVEEAVLLADRIVLMHEGKLEQHDTPERFWLRPASPFVERFFGGELSLEILSRHAVADIKLDPPDGEGLPAVAAEATLREALATMVTHGEDRVRIVGTDGGSLGTLAFCSLIAVLRAEA